METSKTFGTLLYRIIFEWHQTSPLYSLAVRDLNALYLPCELKKTHLCFRLSTQGKIFSR